MVTLVFGVHTSYGQSFSIGGYVLDRETSEGLPGVTITIYNAEDSLLAGALSNIDGQYLLSDLPHGKHTLRMTMASYDTLMQAIEIAADGPALLRLQDALLAPEALEIDGITISYNAPQNLDRQLS